MLFALGLPGPIQAPDGCWKRLVSALLYLQIIITDFSTFVSCERISGYESCFTLGPVAACLLPFPPGHGLPGLVTASGGCLIAMLTAFLALQDVQTKLSSADASPMAIREYDSDCSGTLVFSSYDLLMVTFL